MTLTTNINRLDSEVFPEVRPLDAIAMNILKKRYFKPGETTWEQVVKRVVDWVVGGDDPDYQLYFDLIKNRYFIPNSPCLVNSGSQNGGLIACFVVDFKDSILDIYKTKLDFALIAKKGGGCGTTLSNLRPKNSFVNGSAHGYAGGPVDFYDTICHDMEVITQAGFRAMAMMGTMSVYHPDIVSFIKAKHDEDKMSTTNMSVVVDDNFMKLVEEDGSYETYFSLGFDVQNGERLNGPIYKAREIFDLIVESAWKNGEPGILFSDQINNNSPYKYSGQKIEATNPCGEQPLPPNGSCNLGSLDITKFADADHRIDLEKFELAVRLSTRFLDKVISKTSFPTEDIDKWAKENRPVGNGIMGLADYYLEAGLAYGSDQALELLEFIMSFMYRIAEDESIALGKTYGVPKSCESLPVPRRNITLLSIAPTGTISLLAGCSSGIEPVFSEITIRNDKTGTYQMKNISVDLPHFRCAVSTNGGKEVTWQEHINTLASAQRFVDAGVSKTINFPNRTHRDTIADAFMMAWKTNTIKGLTVYRNGSREKEVLSPKELKKDRCPVCKEPVKHEEGCTKCTKCDWKMCD